jgi:hypothetical protein
MMTEYHFIGYIDEEMGDYSWQTVIRFIIKVDQEDMFDSEERTAKNKAHDKLEYHASGWYGDDESTDEAGNSYPVGFKQGDDGWYETANYEMRTRAGEAILVSEQTYTEMGRLGIVTDLT